MNNSAIVYKILEKSGWHVGRKIDKTLIIQYIVNEGYPVLEKVIDFLEMVWDLTIHFENKRNGLKKDDISFLFEKATHLEVPERVNKDYSLRIGKKLCLIGSVYRDHMVLMMADDNTVYGGYDDFLCKIGDSGMDAIEAIIFDYDFIEIPDLPLLK